MLSAAKNQPYNVDDDSAHRDKQTQMHMPNQKYFIRQINPYAAGGEFLRTQNCAKKLKNDRNPGLWVFIWEYSARANQWIPTWQGLDGYQKSLHPCALRKVALALEGFKEILEFKLNPLLRNKVFFIKYAWFAVYLSFWNLFFIFWITIASRCWVSTFKKSLWMNS